MVEAAEIRQALTARLEALPPVIEPAPTALTAFVGRSLRGPLHQPVRIDSFADFQRQFGGLWQPATLGYAVAQFFEQGGQQALIVRVANGARAASITLPGPGGALKLRGINPGTREFLRAAVDYDGIPADDSERFNLIVQRIQAPGTELIEDQEIFRRVALREDAERSLLEALRASRLVRLEGALPTARPAVTTRLEPGPATGYIASAADGDDGAEISDYDLIGSADDLTGLAALGATREPFSLLCIPPLSRERDVGLATWMIAARLCRQRQALLIVDPPRSWTSAEAALKALPEWSFNSTDACLFFPRLQQHDRLRGRAESFAPCGAVAGMLAAADARAPLWSAASSEDAPLRAPAQLSLPVSETQRGQLAAFGINVLRTAQAPPGAAIAARTLVPDRAARTELHLLDVRRLAHCVVASVTQGTRWALLEAPTDGLWIRLRAQVEAFLESFAQQGALVGDRAEDGYFVICDARLNPAAARASGELRLLFGFAPVRPAEFLTYLITHKAGGSQVRVVSVNRVMTHRHRGTEEIETSILQGLLA